MGTSIAKIKPSVVPRFGEELILGRRVVRFDRPATVAAYRSVLRQPGTEKCNCAFCRNFDMQRERIFPKSFVNLMNRLGIDPTKDYEVFAYSFKKGNHLTYCYGGWFLFCGQLVRDLGAPHAHPNAAFGYRITSNFPVSGLASDLRLCAVEFDAQVPWSLNEPPPDAP